jgi:diguanylate cyclase (GGDEF)-like protein/PAS domain S-box-containing protein
MTEPGTSREPWSALRPDDLIPPAVGTDVKARLLAIEERFQFLAENSQDYIFRYRMRPEPGFDYVSPACERVTGYSPAELYADPGPVLDMLEAQYLEMSRVTQRTSGIARPWELLVRRKDGSTVWVEQRLTLVRAEDGRILALEGIARDVSQRKLAEDRLAYQALHDELTGLPNRRLLRDRISQALARAGRDGGLVAVAFLDLDRFKIINDSRGHAEGDRVLVAIGERLRGAVRASDTVARFGGDEFVVVRDRLSSRADASDFAARLIREVQRRMPVDNGELVVNASVGVAISGTGDTPESLLRDADAAMYKAKERGRARAEIATKSAQSEAEARLTTEQALRRAVERNDFEVHYQPIVAVNSRGLLGLEALVRWRHPELGLVQPDEFIAIAEETGLIRPLGMSVLRQVCEQLKAWRQAGIEDRCVSVNLSASQLASPDLVGNVFDAIMATGIDARQLCFEITESVLMDDVDVSVEILRDLKHLGVKLSIDDFGTGYSSLSHLKRFPVNALKIDRSFIERLAIDREDTAIVAAIIALGRAVGLAVVAEGVESEGQLRVLADLGCDAAQGYLFSRPMPATEIPRAAPRASGRSKVLAC